MIIGGSLNPLYSSLSLNMPAQHNRFFSSLEPKWEANVFSFFLYFQFFIFFIF